MVPEGHDAGPGVGREIGREPAVLCRSGTRGDIFAVAVEDDDVPRRVGIPGVVALAAGTGSAIVYTDAVPIVEVSGCFRRGLVLMTAHYRLGLAAKPAPGWFIALLEEFQCAFLVH
jgi:hypothetical protein